MTLTLLLIWTKIFLDFLFYLKLVCQLKEYHLLLNKLGNPAAGPLNSVPAIGCEAIN